jgi:hypothetical protein
MAETFKFLFTYYGWKFFLYFKDWYLQSIKLVKDEPLIAICSELATGFLSTIPKYGHIKEARKHYKEVFDTLIDAFEECSDESCRDIEASIEYFIGENDPKRFDFLLDDLLKKRSLIDAPEHTL